MVDGTCLSGYDREKGAICMEQREKSLLPLVIPVAVSVLVLCITAGYALYRYLSERAYRERWKDYDDCGYA